jgi:hypothetical protein
VNNFFSCDKYTIPTQFLPSSNQFFFIDNDRGISGGSPYLDVLGSPYLDVLVIHRFNYQPQQIQNTHSQQTYNYFGRLQ